ncbi:MAG: hypothetical protein ISS55_10105, partial [Dehalococcoidales bacterium]|nr:hypothetical protein [Dehalococcoidales bacterium]
MVDLLPERWAMHNGRNRLHGLAPITVPPAMLVLRVSGYGFNLPQVRCEVKGEKNMQDDSSLQDGLPLDGEKTEDIAEQIQSLVEQDNHLAAIELFSQLRPGDQGEVMEDLPLATQQGILTTLPPEEAAEILEHLEPEDVAKVSEGVDSSVLSDILDEADSDVTADVLRQLPIEQAQDVLGRME